MQLREKEFTTSCFYSKLQLELNGRIGLSITRESSTVSTLEMLEKVIDQANIKDGIQENQYYNGSIGFSIFYILI